MKLFVAGFPPTFEKEQLSALFEPYGNIIYVKIVFDHDSGRSKGFGFVEMESEADGNKAIRDLNKTVPNGFKYPLHVEKAVPKK